MAIFVVGGFNLDITGQPQKELILRDSNIGRVRMGPGGVGFNMAADLAKMGRQVELVCALGETFFTPLLLQAAAEQGVGLSYCSTLPGSSGVYLCLNDENHDMFVALNDMETCELLSPRHIDMDVLNRSEAILLDCNISRETLEFVAQNATVPIVADPVSVAKAGRIKDLLPFVHTIKPNLFEARLLTGQNTPKDCAMALVGLGVQRAFVSLGEEGMAFADAFGCHGSYAPPRLDPVNTTGAGDAAAAALCCALLLDLDTPRSAGLACKAAGLTIMTENAVSELLTPEIMEEFLP